MERKLITEIESLLGDKPFGRNDLMALANHIQKPAYRAYGLKRIIQYAGVDNSQEKNLKITMEVVQETVHTSSEMEFVIMVKILLGCYLLGIKQAKSEESICSKQVTSFISKVRPYYLSRISQYEQNIYLKALVLEALREEGNVNISENDGKELVDMVRTVDMICARNYIKDALNLSERFFLFETDTVPSVVRKISEIITC